jgi:hypothetical protein
MQARTSAPWPARAAWTTCEVVVTLTALGGRPAAVGDGPDRTESLNAADCFRSLSVSRGNADRGGIHPRQPRAASGQPRAGRITRYCTYRNAARIGEVRSRTIDAWPDRPRKEMVSEQDHIGGERPHAHPRHRAVDAGALHALPWVSTLTECSCSEPRAFPRVTARTPGVDRLVGRRGRRGRTGAGTARDPLGASGKEERS